MNELQKYYEYLKSNGADVPDTFESFHSTLQDETAAKQYHQYLVQNKFDAPADYESFANTLGLKKKDAGTTPSPVSSENSSVYHSEDHQPSIPESEPFDPLKLAKQADELSKKQIAHVSGGTGGAGVGFSVDADAQKQGEQIKNQLKEKGYDADELLNDFGDMPEHAFLSANNSIDKFLQQKKENPVEYNMHLNGAKNQWNIFDNVYKKALEENADNPDKETVAKEQAVYAANMYNHLNGYKDLATAETNIQEQQKLIRDTLPADEAIKAIDRLKQSSSHIFTPANEDLQNEFKTSGLADKIDLNEYAGLKTLQIFNPIKYSQYIAFIQHPIEKVYTHIGENEVYTSHGATAKKGEIVQLRDRTINEQIGQEKILRDIAGIGRTNAIENAQRKMYSLNKEYGQTEDAQRKNEIADEYAKNQSYIQSIQDDSKKDASKFPLINQMQLDEQIKEQTKSAPSLLNYGSIHFGHTLANAAKSIENLVFDSPELQRARLGEGVSYQHETYLPESLRAEGKNILSKATAYQMAGFMGDVAGIITASAMSPGGATTKIGKIVKGAAPLFLTSQADYYRQAVADGNTDPNGYANLHATVVALAGLIAPKLDYVKKVLGESAPELAKAVEGISEKEWGAIVDKNKSVIDRFKDAAATSLKESAKQAVVYGGGVSIANDLADKVVYNKEVTMTDAVDHALQATKDMFVGGLPLAGVHAITAFRNVPDAHKALLWEIGDHKDIELKRVADKINAGEITPEQGEKRSQIIKQVSGLISKVPVEDSKGNPLSEKQRMDYLHNLYIKTKATEISKDIPSAQKEKVENISAVADHKNALMIDPKTDKQLESTQGRLEKKLENADKEDSEVKLNDKEKKDIEAQVEAIKETLKERSLEGVGDKTVDENTDFYKVKTLYGKDGVEYLVRNPKDEFGNYVLQRLGGDKQHLNVPEKEIIDRVNNGELFIKKPNEVPITSKEEESASEVRSTDRESPAPKSEADETHIVEIEKNKDDAAITQRAGLKIPDWVKRMFTSNRGLPDNYMALHDEAIGERSIASKHMRTAIYNLQQGMKKSGFKDVDVISEALQKASNDPGNTAFHSLPAEVKAPVAEMRAMVDGYSQRLVNNGLVTKSQALTIEDNIGEYLTRAYKLYTDKKWGEKLSESGDGKKVIEDAVRFLTQQRFSELAKDPNHKNTPQADLVALAGKLAEQDIKDILTLKQTPVGQRYTESISRDISSLKQRKDIPEPIRKLMGEYTDPVTSFAITISKLATLHSQSELLNKMKDQFTGVLFFNKDDVRPEGFNYEVATDGSQTWNPLSGMYTNQQVIEAIQETAKNPEPWYVVYQKAFGMVKKFKTIYSLPTQTVNFFANPLISLANGHFRMSELGKSWSYYKDTMFNGERGTDVFVEAALKHNVIGQSVNLRMIRDMLRKDKADEFALEEFIKPKSKIAPLNWLKSADKIALKQYGASDSFWKIYGFMNEAVNWSDALYGTEYKNLTEAQKTRVHEIASERIKNTYPTYDRALPGLMWIGKNIPFIGNFMAFQAEVLRNIKNNFSYAMQDLKSDDPKVKALGAKRMGGITSYIALKTGINYFVTTATGHAVSSLWATAFGNDDEENKRKSLDRFSPEWLSTHNLMVEDKGEGVFKVFDIDRLDPYNMIWQSANAGFLGKEGGLQRSINEIEEPFIEPDMIAQATSEIIDNKDRNGYPVYNPADSKLNQTLSKLKYIWGTVEPTTIKYFDRVIKSDEPGKEATFSLLGARGYDIDAGKSFKSKLREADEKMTYNDQFNYFDKETATKYRENAKGLILEMHDYYKSALSLGVSPKKAEEIFSKSFYNNRRIKKLMVYSIRTGDVSEEVLKKLYPDKVSK